jgi:hypothetical protein
MTDTTDQQNGGEPAPEQRADEPAPAHRSGDESEREPPADDEQPVPETGSAQTGRPERLDTPDQVDRRGWLLVTLVVLSVLVIPLFVLYIPEAHWLIGRLGFSQRQAYIVFPMLPAVLLGLTAVWATVRAYSE